MKKTTCKALAGACDMEIHGATPEEMGENSKKHAMEMVQKGDEAHKAAMENMMKMTPEEQKKWHEKFNAEFDALPDA
jgi:arginyl-tRNA synthetase